MSSRAETLSAATKDPIVALHKFNKLRSREGEKLVLVFEGFEDPVFFSAIAVRCNFLEPYAPLVANGKDYVLGLRRLLRESEEANLGKGVAFIVDRDFDDLKGHESGPDIYCTETYSIENIATHDSVVRDLLLNELKLHDPDLLDDLDRCTQYFADLCQRFEHEIRDLNLLIYFGRTKSESHCGSRLVQIDDHCKLFKLDRNDFSIHSEFKGNEAKKIARFSTDFDFSETECVESAFALLDPRKSWRGKYWLELMKKFLEILIEDRNSDTPQHFRTGKGRVSLSLVGDTRFRTFGSICPIPDSLKTFLTSLPQAALQRA